MKLLRKMLFTAVALTILAAIGILATVARVEKYCVAAGPPAVVTSDFGIDDDGYARAQGDSFLTFPEWYIVHAYSDLAGMAEGASESNRTSTISPAFEVFGAACATQPDKPRIRVRPAPTRK